jgi:hypothetical protein
MTPAEFQDTAIALLGSAVGWQSAIARRLGIGTQTVRRWLASGKIPPSAEQRLAEITGRTDPAALPRDEWIIGDASSGREYVYHARPPRFLARVVMCNDRGLPELNEAPVDIVSGVVYASDDYMLAEIDWIDEVAPGEVAKWLEAAADAIDSIDD